MFVLWLPACSLEARIVFLSKGIECVFGYFHSEDNGLTFAFDTCRDLVKEVSGC